MCQHLITQPYVKDGPLCNDIRLKLRAHTHVPTSHPLSDPPKIPKFGAEMHMAKFV